MVYTITVCITHFGYCGKYLGTFCSLRAKDGTDLLHGDCERDTVYSCFEMYGRAEAKYYCTNCQGGGDIGKDRCPS